MQAQTIEPENGLVGGPSIVSTGQFVTFSSGMGDYGVDIMMVREIRSWQPATPLAGRTPVSRGVLDIRGQVVEVLDLAALLGGALTNAGRGSVVLVLAKEDKTFGLLVDSVSDIIQVERHAIMPVPEAVDGSHDSHLFGMVNHEGRMIGLLSLEELF